MTDREHSRELHMLRATPILARSMYTELMRARYSREEVLRFVNKLLECLQTYDEALWNNPGSRPTCFVDVESGLPNAQATRSILGFEVRRAIESASHKLCIASLEIELPPELDADTVRAIHDRFVRILRSTARSSDVLGRIGLSRYLVILSGASMSAVDALATRVENAMADERKSCSMLRAFDEVRVRMRSLAHGTDDSGEAFLERLIESESTTLVDRVKRKEARKAPVEVVLALGGGAARAIAHVGVIRSLEAAGVKVAGVSGVSGGALVGAMYALGQDTRDILERFQRFSRSNILKEMRHCYAEVVRSRRGRSAREEYFRRSDLTFASENWENIIPDELYGEMFALLCGPDRSIATLPIPFSATAAELVEGRAVEISCGSLISSLKASCAVPGLFPAQRIGRRIFIDGSTISELPLSASIEISGEARVLSVHLSRPEPSVREYASSADMAVRAAHLVHRELVRAQLANADALLTIPARDHGWLAFRDAAKLVELGESIASARLPVLLSIDPTDDRTRTPTGVRRPSNRLRQTA